MTLGLAYETGQRWLTWLRAQPGVERAEAAGQPAPLEGNHRRPGPGRGDRDPAALMKAFTTRPEVDRILGQGENKSSVELKDGTRIQLWAQPPECFGALWMYATGSKDHNVRVRELAQRKGLSLSERGLLDSQGGLLRYPSEEEVYAALGLDWIPPELREDRGEIEAAANHELPRLIELADLRMELHTHSTWSDGALSIEEMARAAIARGYKVLAITDHSSYLGITGGMKPEDLPRQRVEIDQVQRKLGDQILLLQGAEVDIRADGMLDYPDEALASLDIVICSLHASLRQPREQITQRLLERHPQPARRHHRPPHRAAAARPGWRRPGLAGRLCRAPGTRHRPGNQRHPHRLDADDVHTRHAAGLGMPIAINTDAHASAHYENQLYGVSVARRAWLEKDAVMNCWEPPRLLDWLAQRGK